MIKTAKLLGLALVGAAVLCPAAMAQAAKIGLVHVQGAIVSTKDGEKARTEITSKFAERGKDMESRATEINKLKETLQKGANTLSAERKEQITREIDDKQKKYQWDAEDLQNDMQQEEQKYVNEIGGRLVGLLDVFAKEKGFTVILDISGQQSPVLWAAEGLDVTQEIVKLYDAKFGGPAAPAAAKPPAAQPPAAPKKPGTVK